MAYQFFLRYMGSEGSFGISLSTNIRLVNMYLVFFLLILCHWLSFLSDGSLNTFSYVRFVVHWILLW